MYGDMYALYKIKVPAKGETEALMKELNTEVWKRFGYILTCLGLA